MSLSLNIWSILVIVLISQGLFASVILLIKKENRQANKYLSLLTCLLSFWLMDTLFRVGGVYSQNPNFYFLPIYFSFGFGPLMFLYTLRLTGQVPASKLKTLLHLVPVFIQFLFYMFLQFQDYAFRRTFWLEIHRPITYDLELALSFLLMLTYLWLSRGAIRKYKLQIENSFSDIDKLTLKWLNQLHIVLFALSVFWFIETCGRLIWNFYPATPLSSISIAFTLIFVAIGAIVQRDLTEVADAFAREFPDGNDKLQVQSIHKKEVERIQQILLKKQLFLIPDLTLKDFSEYVGLAPREVSHLINRGLGISFIDFINQYRISKFKELVNDESLAHYSLLGLAFESGFNSKSTFNRVFRKMQGTSPSTYLNKIKT